MDDNGRLVGIISERDCTRKMILQDKNPDETPVSEIMTADVVFARRDTTVDKCMSLMTYKHIRHLPILEGEELVGIITAGDLMKFTIRHLELTIKELENFVMAEKA